jgi:hypothetical protein
MNENPQKTQKRPNRTRKDKVMQRKKPEKDNLGQKRTIKDNEKKLGQNIGETRTSGRERPESEIRAWHP